MEKICIKCGERKSIEEFPRRKYKSGKLGHRNDCRDCYLKLLKTYKQPTKPLINKVCPNCGKEFKSNQSNKIKCNKRCLPMTDDRRLRAYVSTLSKEELKIYRRERYKGRYEYDKDKARKQRLKWKQEHLIEYRARKQAYKKKRIALDPEYKLKTMYSLMIYQALKGIKRYNHSIEFLGESIPFVRKYIESLWQPGMTWDNWTNDGWHLDHVIPKAHFDLNDPEQQRQCFHYTNLQPLWSMDNVMKRDKIIERQLILL